MTEEVKKEESQETPNEETPENEDTTTEETPVEDPKTPEKIEEDAGDEETPERENLNKEKPEGESEDDEESKETKGKFERTPRMMEVYKHKIAENKWGTERKGFETTIADLSNQLKRKASPERAEAVKDLIEKSGLEPEVVESFMKVAEMGNTILQKEVEGLKAQIKENSEKTMWVEQDKRFEQDFEKSIAPILKSENIPSENIPRLKKLLKTYAFTEDFAKSPLSVVYRGIEDFKQFLPSSKKKSGESARGGLRGEETTKSILEMTPKEFDEYISREGKAEGGMDLRRDGRSIKE